MLENSSIYVITEEDEIFRLGINNETQKIITTTLEKKKNEFLNLSQVKFDGVYKLDDEEVYYIDNFDMPKIIKDAIKYEASVEDVEVNNLNIKNFDLNSEKNNIKAIMIGVYDNEKNEYTILFQNFHKSQYILPVGKFDLIYNKNTFVLDKRSGISILNSIDCLYISKKLLFKSWFYAKGIFDLNQYYREATDDEVNAFLNDDKLDFGDTKDKEKLLNTVNTTIRKLITSLNNSRVLKKYKIEEIEQKAKNFDINIRVKDKKIIMPKENVKIKEILRFLNDDIYLGDFLMKSILVIQKLKRINNIF